MDPFVLITAIIASYIGVYLFALAMVGIVHLLGDLQNSIHRAIWRAKHRK